MVDNLDPNPVEGPNATDYATSLWNKAKSGVSSWWGGTRASVEKSTEAVSGVFSTTPLSPRDGDNTRGTPASVGQTGNDTTFTDSSGSSITTTNVEGRDGYEFVDLSSVKWRENPLSRYRNFTYNITLSACRDLPNVSDYKAYMSNRLSDDVEEKFVIIAQSGSTKYNITSLTMEQKVGPGPVTRSSFMTAITMEITEPLGVTLIDTLKNTAEVLGNVNYAKNCYFLEVRFNAYDENGVMVSSDVGVGFNDDDTTSGRKEYGFYLVKVVILTIEPTINEAGSTYRITLMPNNEIAFTDNNYRLQAPLKCSGKTTEQTLISLADKLNEEVRTRYLGRQVTKYRFSIESDELKSFAMKTDDPMKTHDGDVNNAGDPEHQSSTGITVGDMVEAIFLNSTMSDRWKEKMENPDFNSDQLKTLIRIFPEVIDLDYDYVNDIYIREIVYHITAYGTLRPIISGESFKKDNSKSEVLLGKLIQENLLRKRYDYIYTGKNTEVLSFDLRFNMNWAAITNAFNGARRGYAASAEAPLHNEQLTEQIYNLDQQLQSSQNIIELFQAQTGQEVVMDGNTQTDLTAEFDRLKAARQELYDLNSSYTGGSRAGYQEKIQILTDLTKDIVERANVIEATRRKTVYDALGKSPSGDRRFRRFAEDIQKRDNSDIVMPVSIQRSSEDFASKHGAGSLGDWSIGKSIMGAVLNQVYGHATTDLSNITMEVRGDPYWFGSSNMDSTTNNSGKSNSSFPVYTYGDHCFLLSIQYPLGFNPETNELILSGSESFNGIYAVNSVTHHMSDGVFKQTLTAARMSVISLEKPQKSVVSTKTQDPSVAPTLTSEAPTDSKAPSSVGDVVKKDNVSSLPNTPTLSTPPVMKTVNDVSTPSPTGESERQIKDALIRKRNEEKELDTQLTTLRAENYQLIDKISMAEASGDKPLAASLKQQQAAVNGQIISTEATLDTVSNERSALIKQLSSIPIQR